MSPALVGRFFTTEPPGKPCTYMFLCYISQYFPRFNTFEIKNIYTHTHTHTQRITLKSFSGGSVVKNPPAMQEAQETQVRSLGQEDPLEEEIASRSSILAWKIP